MTTVVGTVNQKYKTIDPETKAEYEWTIQVNQSYSRTDTWSGEVEGKTFQFTNNPETGDQSYTAIEPYGKVPGRITVHTNDSDDTFTLKRSDLQDVKLTANGTFAQVDVTGTAVYHVGAKNGNPAFDVPSRLNIPRVRTSLWPTAPSSPYPEKTRTEPWRP